MPSLEIMEQEEIEKERLESFKNEITNTINNANLRGYNKTNIFIVKGTLLSVDLVKNLKKLQKEYFQEYKFELEEDRFVGHPIYWVHISKDPENSGVFELKIDYKAIVKKWVIRAIILSVLALLFYLACDNWEIKRVELKKHEAIERGVKQ